MPYQINLIAQNNRYRSSYRALIEKIKQQFPQFKNLDYDIEHWLKVFKNYAKEEILQKGWGIELEAEFYDGIPKEREIEENALGWISEIRHEDWIKLSFWQNGYICLEAPNYPYREIAVAMADILSVVNFLEQEGFALDHPTKNKIIPRNEVEAFLYRSYLGRQIIVDKVSQIVSGE